MMLGSFDDPKLIEAATKVRLLLMDCDGVLTDGRLFYGESGEALKVFDVQDGLGIVNWRREGNHSGIISGRSSPIVEKRAAELGIQFVIQGSKEKLWDARTICDELGLGFSETAYIGDDLPDIDLIRAVGLGVAPSNARGEVKSAADFVTKSPGGRGAVRELIDILLSSRNS
jgi:3-deoxy-D-manno-octulosonate 8-phosphate phosphatase (KDO 8-P phosphatase)